MTEKPWSGAERRGGGRGAGTERGAVYVAAICVGHWGTSAEGASVERRRREDRGAEGVGCADGVWDIKGAKKT